MADDPAAVSQLAATITSLWNPPAEPAPPPTPFAVRRVANPRWRPPETAAALPRAIAAVRPKALDHLSAQLFRSERPSGPGASHWQVLAGEQGRNEDMVELFAAVSQNPSRPDLEGLRLSARRGLFSGGLGDQAPLAFGRQVSLQRLRGGFFRVGSTESGLTALGGVPTPVLGMPTAPLRIGGLALENARFDVAQLSMAAMAFARGETPGLPGPDAYRGRGALGSLAWKVPLAGGALAGSLGGQLHSLDGIRALAVAQGLSWDYTSRRVVAAIASERNTRHTRMLGTDRFAPAPSAEDRWSLAARSAGGRAESHLTGVLRRGGEQALEARTIGWGLSGAFGRSAWYGGADAVWDARPTLDERRFSVQAGRALAGSAVLARIEYSERPNTAGTVAALGETSFPLPHSLRLELEPRLGFAERMFRQGQLTSRLSGPLGGSGARVTGSVAVGADRDAAFRGSVREAALALSWSPRGRDRSDLEARRLDEDGRASMEYSARYETFLQRYDVPPEWAASRDTGRVTVVVGRTGNGSGMPDVLISLDGQTLRFTDADGIARFDRVAPGVHTIAIEERSLDQNLEVVGTSRVFVTVERGRVPEPVRFTIGRKERRTQF